MLWDGSAEREQFFPRGLCVINPEVQMELLRGVAVWSCRRLIIVEALEHHRQTAEADRALAWSVFANRSTCSKVDSC